MQLPPLPPQKPLPLALEHVTLKTGGFLLLEHFKLNFYLNAWSFVDYRKT